MSAPTALTGREAWGPLVAYVRPYRGSLAWSCLLLLFATAMDLVKPWPLKFVIDHILTPATGGTAPPWLGALDPSTQLLVACLGVIGVAVVGGVAEYHSRLRVAQVGHTAAAALKSDVFEHLQRLSLSFHRHTGSGELLTRVVKDVQEIKTVLGDTASETLSQVALLVGMAIVLVSMDASLALVSIGVFGPIGFCVDYYARNIREVTKRQRQKDSRAASIMSEAMAMLPAVQLFGQGQHASGSFGRANRKGLEAEVKAARMKGQLERWVEVIVAVGTAGVLWYGAKAALDGRLTAGDLVIFTAYLKSMYKPARRVAANWLQMSRATVGAERVVELLRTEPTVVDLPHARPAPAFRGDIAFEAVAYGYDGGRDVLREVSATVPAGALVAVVGRSGAGKSTLLSLLPRLMDPSSGVVRIDGCDVRDFTLATLRRQIALVTQEAMLFGLSVRDNVAYGDPVPDDERVRAALEAAGVWPVVARMPAGLETKLGERGASLSGGERQRIAIARAFYRDARILVLDEPTTGLDSYAEAHVLASLATLVRGRTTFVITHRMATIAHADLVLFLENGRLVEVGTPAALQSVGGRYRELVDLQTASTRPL